MLSIRMKRLGRKGHPTYRVVVQDSRQSPSSGKYVALLGSYDPHTKQSTLVKDKAEFYLKHGAQPSDRVAALFRTEKITLPKWVEKPTKKEKSIRNADKLRKNRPAEEATDKKPEAPEQQDEIPVDNEEIKAETKPAEPEAKTTEAEADKKPDTDTGEDQEASAEAPKPETDTGKPADEDKS